MNKEDRKDLVTEKMVDAAARVLNKRLAEGNGLHGVSRDMLETALSASPSPVDSRDAREEPDTDAAELIALINNRIGSQFDDEATFSATEALRIMIALERRVAE